MSQVTGRFQPPLDCPQECCGTGYARLFPSAEPVDVDWEAIGESILCGDTLKIPSKTGWWA